jgi:ABC-type cobalt transport system substrate-binding protein
VKFGETRKLVLILLIVAVVYSVLAFFVLPTNSFFTGDEGVKFIQIQSLVKNSYRDISLVYPGQGIDERCEFCPIVPPYAIVRNNKMYSQWPIFYPFLASIFYKYLGFPGLYVLPVISSVLTIFFAAKIMKLLTERISFFWLLILALASPLFFYSLVLWEHAFSILLTTAGVLLLLKAFREPKNWYYLAAGILFGFSIWTRNELYLLVVALLIVYFTLQLGGRRGSEGFVHSSVGTVYLLLGLMVVLLPVWTFQKLTVGEFLGADVSQFIKAGIVTEATPFKGNFLSFLIYKIKLAAVLLLHRFKDERMVLLGLFYIFLFALIAFPKIRRSYLFYLSLFGIVLTSALAFLEDPLATGLLTNTPFIALVPLSLLIPPLVGRKGMGDVRLIFWTCVVFVLLVAIFAPATGGLQWGPRFLLPVVPLFVILLSFAWQGLQGIELEDSVKRVVRISFMVLVLLSFAVQLTGVSILREDRVEGARLARRIAERGEDVFVIDVFWFPQETASLYFDKRYYYVDDVGELDELVAKLNQHQIAGFSYVTLEEGDGLRIDGKDELVFVEKESLPGGFILEAYYLGRRGD